MDGINIKIRNRAAENASGEAYICGNSDYTVKFDFDEEWEHEFVKTARFEIDKKEHVDVVFEGTECKFPKVDNADIVMVGVFAGDLMTTTAAKVYCLKSVISSCGTPENPEDDVYNQIIAILNQIVGKYAGIEDISFSEETDEGNIYAVLLTDGRKYYITTPKGDRGETGMKGDPGNGIQNIEDYYALSAESNNPPSVWATIPPVMTEENRYLWNYETVTYTNGTEENTEKRIIGVYGDRGETGMKGDPGETGADGKSIGQITHYYLATAAANGVTTSTSGWTTTVQSVSADKKYLWKYEIIKYSDGTLASESEPYIIGSYGDKGNVGDTGEKGERGETGATGIGITSHTVSYQKSDTSGSIPSGEWSNDIPALSQGDFLWTRTELYYSNGEMSVAYSVSREGIDGAAGKDAKIDATLTKTGEAADAKVVGDEISALKEADTDLDNRLSIVEKQVANINLDNVDMRNISLDIAEGTAPEKYPVGTQIVTSWDRVDANGAKTSYNPEQNIVHYANVAVKDNAEDETEHNENVMFLEWDKTIPDGIAFCIQQALQIFDGTEGAPDGLPAGMYSIKMKAPNGGSTFKTRWNGKYLTFTLTKDIPSGGILMTTVSNWNGTTDSDIAIHVITYDSDLQSASKIEEVIVTTSTDSLPDGATYMGEVWGDDVGYGKLNHPECSYYGDSNWAYSDLRQYYNGEGADWWKKLSRYHRKPNIATSLQGFLTGLDAGMKKQMKLIKNTTIGNNQKYAGQKFVTYDKVFLHSFNQSNITTDYLTQFDNEGERWEYYRRLADGVSNLNTNGMFTIWNTYPILIRYAINAQTTAQYVFSRSARLGIAYGVYYVSTSGACGYTNASYGNRSLPACIIGSDNHGA